MAPPAVESAPPRRTPPCRMTLGDGGLAWRHGSTRRPRHRSLPRDRPRDRGGARPHPPRARRRPDGGGGRAGRRGAAVGRAVRRRPRRRRVPPLPPRLDVLVHSAGVEDGGRVADTDRAEWERVFAINLFAVADLTRAALPALRAAAGIVVAINSGSGLVSAPGGGGLRGVEVRAARVHGRAAGGGARRRRPRQLGPPGPHRLGHAAREGARGRASSTTPRYVLDPASVAAVVRTVVDLPPGGTVESLSIRPTRIRPR